jgi:hypothetical protein
LGIRLGIGALQGLTKVVLFAGPAAARPAKPEPITPSSASTYERRCGVAPRNLKAGRGGRRETPSRSEKPGAHRGEKPRRLSKRTLRNSEPKRRPPKSDAHGPATGRKPSKAPIRRTDPTRLVSNSAVQDICARNRWECGSGGAGGGGGQARTKSEKQGGSARCHLQSGSSPEPLRNHTTSKFGHGDHARRHFCSKRPSNLRPRRTELARSRRRDCCVAVRSVVSTIPRGSRQGIPPPATFAIPAWVAWRRPRPDGRAAGGGVPLESLPMRCV